MSDQRPVRVDDVDRAPVKIPTGRVVLRGDLSVPKRHTVGGEDGAPPWLVRWSDDGHEGLFFPGPDAVVEHLTEHSDRD